MEYRKFKDTLIVRIDKGEEIRQQLRRVSEQEGIRLVEVSALGAVNDVSVALLRE